MNETLKIHDIKGLVEVPDYSIYIYYGLIAGAIFLVCLILYLIYSYFRNKKQNIRKVYFAKLQAIDFEQNSSKQNAYEITKYGQLLAITTREQQLLNDLICSLESYKYKKEVESFDDKTKALYDRFMEALDV